MSRTIPHYHRSHRRKAGLTQADVAALLAVTNKATISRYESGRRLPPLEIALAYEAVFGVPVAELFRGAYEKARQAVRGRAERLRANLKPSRVERVHERRKRSIDFLAAP
jgi:transcriptional regulator with XRE-family HTH domain